MLSQGGAGARAGLGGAGEGGVRALTSCMPVTQIMNVERVMFEPVAHTPVSALSCQSPFNARRCHDIGTRSVLHRGMTRAQRLTLPAWSPHPNTAPRPTQVAGSP